MTKIDIKDLPPPFYAAYWPAQSAAAEMEKRAADEKAKTEAEKTEQAAKTKVP
jgi:hypothetical protein